MSKEYFHIQNWKKNEQKQDVSRSDEDDVVFYDDGGFTFCDGVPTVNVYELDDNPHNGE